VYGWRFHFQADLDSLTMYASGMAGTFAYVCTVLDRHGTTVGQDRGVAELREPQMMNANKCVKMALKRAQVDAVLRCAGLSQWFTQDLEEPLFVASETRPQSDDDRPAARGTTARCTPSQVKDIHILLKAARRHEAKVLGHYNLRRLDDLPSPMTERLIDRLTVLAYARR